ncbi:DUF946 domain-containing protein [Tolypocladium paradoxum]|uniref:DUF946 domain-containing protein n=1 Tax=Tolypocladium paradoxum TaxID=94208 RepID=A0A2S4L497_9HYPO|nr:DUF946 domain-containing protein [Tolypocladium paradoxum]
MANQTRDYGDLRVTLTSAYDWVWSDTGSGAARDATFWQPKPQGTLRAVGSVGIGNYSDINGKRASLLVGVNPNKPPVGGKPAVAAPTGYTLIWTDKKSGGRHNGSFWRPNPPSGYVSLGDVAQGNWDMPRVDKVWCVRRDLVREAKYAPNSLWDDKKSGAEKDVSCWDMLPDSIGVTGAENIPIRADAYRAHQSYSRPDINLAWVLALPIPKDFKRFEAAVPKITPSTIPSRGDQFSFLEQCTVLLPFVAFFSPTDQRSLDNIRNPFCSVGRSIAWLAEGVWVNGSGGPFHREQTIKYGISSTQKEEMTHSAGVEVSASGGIGFANFGISLNYQFTYQNSHSFTEYSEKSVTERFEVPAHHATVLFSKHIWLKATRSDGSHVLVQIEITANDDVYFSGCELPKNFEVAAEHLED